MILIITEKENYLKAIIKYLNFKNEVFEKNEGYYKSANYLLSWTTGHLLKLKPPEYYDQKYKNWNLESLPIFFKNWEKIPLSKKENAKANFQYNILKKLVFNSKITVIYHAGTPDDEGQYVIDEILDYLKNQKKVKRLLINDTTIHGVEKAFNNLQDNNNFISIGQSAYGRAVADYMFGINLSRYFTCKNNVGTLSLGRVQTPTLAMIVNRDNLVENHVKEKYYELFSNIQVIKSSNKNENFNLEKLKKDYIDSFHNEELANSQYNKMLKEYEALNSNIDITLKYNVPQRKEFPNKKVIRKDFLESISSLIEMDNNLKINVTKKIEKEDPPLPLDLSKLQILCSDKFNYSPKEVMNVTQVLRDKYNAITYNKSECQYCSIEQYLEAEETLPIVLSNLKIVLPEINLFLKSKAFNNENIVTHTAIIPTQEKIDLSSLNEKEKNIYKLISDYYIVQFLPSRIYETTTVTMKIYEDTELKCSSTKTLNIGFKTYLSNVDEEKQEEEISEISSLMNGEYLVKLIQNKIETKYIDPPKYYTEGEIIYDMCSISKYVDNIDINKILKLKSKKIGIGNIGTSTTRSIILENLYKRGFIIKEGKNVKSTKLGRELISILPSDVTKPNLTALWWLKQEDIKNNFLSTDKFLESVLDNIKDILNTEYKTLNLQVKNKEKVSLGKCPICGKNIYKGEFKDKNTNEKRYNYYCENCKFKLYDKMKHYKSTLEITDEKAKTLLNNEPTFFTTLIGKDGLEFEGKLKLKINRILNKNYVNFEYIKSL